MGEDLGLTLPTLGALLGRSVRGVTSGYIHKLDPALVAAANRVAGAIAANMDGASSLSRVVQMPVRQISG
jgi:hypothetical protein